MSLTITFCAYDSHAARGGPYAWAVDFVGFLSDSDFVVRLLILCPGGKAASSIASSLDSRKVEIEVLDTLNTMFLEEQTQWIVSKWFDNPTDIFIANLVLPAMYASRWIREAGGKTVAVIHSDPLRDKFYGDVVKHFVSGKEEWRLDVVVSVSEYIARNIRLSGGSVPRIAVIPCGTSIPLTAISASREPLRLLYCGRLVEEQKRLRRLVDAFVTTCETLGTFASICGDGPERSWLEDRLLGDSHVSYLGSIPPAAIPAVMAQHDVIVLLSDYEGLPMSLVEGMAGGLVPVGLDEPSGVREVIADGVNGLIVSDTDESFVSAIRSLSDPDFRERLSKAARATAIAEYSHRVVFAKWRALLQDLLPPVTAISSPPPASVTLGDARVNGSFTGYPATRRGPATIRHRFAAGWLRFRQTARPRSRFRAVAAFLRSR